MSTRITLGFAAVLVLLFVPPVGLFAADGNSPVLYRIRGHVVDQNQAIIPGAKVTVVGIGKAQGRTVSTDTEGEFDLMLEPGEYRLAVEANGFSRQSQKIVVGTNDMAPIEMVLLVAEKQRDRHRIRRRPFNLNLSVPRLRPSRRLSMSPDPLPLRQNSRSPIR